jgi:hypothetical protein
MLDLRALSLEMILSPNSNTGDSRKPAAESSAFNSDVTSRTRKGSSSQALGMNLLRSEVGIGKVE